MTIQKFADGAGFVAIDLEGADRNIGIVRLARKILEGGAADLARSLTYTFASLELRQGGASGGINADGDERDATVAAVVEELRPLVDSGRFLPDPGKGLTADDLAPLADADPRSALRLLDRDGVTFADELAALSAVTAAERVLDGLDGQPIAIEGYEVNGPALTRELASRNARIVAVSTVAGTVSDRDGLDPAALAEAWTAHGPALIQHVGAAADTSVFDAEAAVLIPSSKMGCLHHGAAAGVQAGVVVPGAALPITARGLAVLRAADHIVVPDFVAQAGPVWAWEASADDDPDAVRSRVVDGVRAIVDDTLDHADGMFLGACHRAEAFLGTWQDTLPFGRPLAA